MNTSTWRGSAGYIKANCGQPGIRGCRSALRLRCMLFTDVYAFHRFGAFLSRAAKVAFKTQVGRNVDDFYGASKRSVQITGGRGTQLAGRPCWKTGRPNKERRQHGWCVRARVDKEKAKHWRGGADGGAGTWDGIKVCRLARKHTYARSTRGGSSNSSQFCSRSPARRQTTEEWLVFGRRRVRHG